MFPEVFGHAHKRRLAATLLIAVALTAVAAAHAAAPHVRGESNSAPLTSDGATHKVVAKCKGHDKVIGGGLKTGDPNDNFLQGSYPTGNRRWTVAAQRPLTHIPSGMISYARCLSSGEVTTRSKTGTQAALSATSSAVAKCKPGEHVLGGGARLSDDANDHIEGTYPMGKRGWKAIGLTSAVSGSSITSYALCAKHLKTKRVHKSKTIQGTGASSVSAKCPKHYAVTGGGIAVSDTQHDSVSGSYPTGRSWVAQGTGEGTKLTAYAICLK